MQDLTETARRFSEILELSPQEREAFLLAFDDAEIRAVYRYVKAIPPPVEAVLALRAWEAAEGIELINDRPADPHLAAAIGLFSGESPLAEAEAEPE